MRFVLDASFFFSEADLPGEASTTPAVIGELTDARSRCRLEALVASGLTVDEPTRESMTRVQEAARGTGDLARLSEADTGILALALDLGATVVTDDYAVQNVAKELDLPVKGILQREAHPRRWRFRCPGCNRRFSAGGTCPVCGSPLKRTLK